MMSAASNSPQPQVPRFASSADELELRDHAAQIAASHAAPQDRSLTLAELREVFSALEPTGYLGSILPGAAGGKGLSALQFSALVEGLAPELTLLGNHSVQRYLHDFGSPAQCERFLPGLLSGRDIGAIAITEPQAGSDLTRLETVARRAGNGYVLNGRKTWVTHGLHASVFVVLARTGDAPGEFTRFILPADTAGLVRRAQVPVGLRHLSFAHLELRDCELPQELRLDAEGAGARGAKAAFPIARLLAALQSLRIAGAALDLAAAYARERIVAAKPLAESSLVQQGYAGLWGRCEAARLLCLRVAADLSAADATALASAAKAMSGELALDACRWASSCMGSAALAADHALVRLHNDARMMAVVDGTSVLNDLVVARRSIGRAAPGAGSA